MNLLCPADAHKTDDTKRCLEMDQRTGWPNQMTEACDGGTGRDEFLYWVTHMPTKTRGKIRELKQRRL